MNKTFSSTSIYGLCASTLFMLSSCSNNASTQNDKAVVEQHHEEGHDHSAHAESAQASTAETAHPAEAVNSQPQPSADLAQGQPVAIIPSFTFYKVKSGISFTNQDIQQGQKTVFILFDPSCPHCRLEASAIGKNYDKVKNINLYFVSMNEPALMASFLETFAKELVNKPNVQMLYDKNQEFIQKFHVPKQFPANYVYSKEGKLETFWDGDKNIGEIIAAYTK